MRNSMLMLTAAAAVIGGLSLTTSDTFLSMIGEAHSDDAKPMMAKKAMAASQSAGTASGRLANNQPVVLELFTSQGCSSCPPADKLAAKIADEGNHLVISRPVTYWDRLGWKDTLAREANTTLQRAYARKGHEGAGVYTPQIVVDGQDGTVGSRESQVRQLARQARGNDTAAIAIRPQDSGAVAVGIDGASDGPAELLLVALDSHESVAIGRGENGGRSVSYTNVLRSEVSLTDWQEGRTSVVVPASRLRVANADRYALILREKNGGPILAARILPG